MNKESFTDILDYCMSCTLISVIKHYVLSALGCFTGFTVSLVWGVYAGKLCTGNIFPENLQKSPGIGPELKFTLY